MRRLVAFALIALAGCGVGGDEKTIDEGRIDELVLQPDDVGAGYVRTFVRNLADHPIAEVRYRPVRPLQGPRMVESSAHVFRSSADAEQGLEADRSVFEGEPPWQPIGEPGLGDESFAATVVRRGVRSYAVYWRAHNATASLSVVALRDELAFADVLELARKQQQRIADAAAR
jgi:hypothetical protein